MLFRGVQAVMQGARKRQSFRYKLKKKLAGALDCL
jgi:hypothetical protein